MWKKEKLLLPGFSLVLTIFSRPKFFWGSLKFRIVCKRVIESYHIIISLVIRIISFPYPISDDHVMSSSDC